ncbi:MAG: hypothetical protein CR985_02980 [Flavobacteriales bacterium]|nr:MAG: hypothetical protein CR985_02980 [Flavobacteriales bacterium]
MFKNFLKLPRNSRFHYTPRYYDGVEEGNIYKFKSKYSKEDTDINYNDFRGHWEEARLDSRNRGNAGISLRLLLIIAVLTLIFLYIIDFDLSIFQMN